MTNDEIINNSGHIRLWCIEALNESEKLIHYVKNGGAITRISNPDGTRFFAATFDSDNEAFDVLNDIAMFILSGCSYDAAINELRVKLDKCLPVVEGIRYAMTYEQAFFLAKTHRPMNDICIIKETKEGGSWRLIDYISGKYAS